MNMERTSLTLIEGLARYVLSLKHYKTLLVEFRITKKFQETCLCLVYRYASLHDGDTF